MSYVEGIPSHIISNMASIQANIDSILAHAASNVRNVGGSKLNFSSFLELNDTSFNTSLKGFEDNIRYVNSPYPELHSKQTQNFEAGNKQFAQNISKENTATIDKAYNSFLNGDFAKNFATLLGANNKSNFLEQLKVKAPNLIDKNTSVITDAEFYNAESLTPYQITEMLKKKGSPYADQTFEDGKSIGQLIYDLCHDAGTIEQGSKTINPAIIMAIMGAESGFGTDPKLINKNNPYNIKLDGSFETVKDFTESLKIAINTMYNWSHNRPADTKVSLLDYAGDKYCEDYQLEWKPNVEKYYAEFAGYKHQNLNAVSNLLASTEEPKTEVINQLLNTMGVSQSGSSLLGNTIGMLKLLQKGSSPTTTGTDPSNLDMELVSEMTGSLNLLNILDNETES